MHRAANKIGLTYFQVGFRLFEYPRKLGGLWGSTERSGLQLGSVRECATLFTCSLKRTREPLRRSLLFLTLVRMSDKDARMQLSSLTPVGKRSDVCQLALLRNTPTLHTSFGTDASVQRQFSRSASTERWKRHVRCLRLSPATFPFPAVAIGESEGPCV